MQAVGRLQAALAVSPSDSGLNGTVGKWVTFSCTGEPTSKSSAMRLYDSAQLAFVRGRTVRIWVDDTKKHNGYCFASRIDVL